MKTTYSQTTNASIQTETERRTQLIEALERAQTEVLAGRKYVAGLEKSIESKEKLIKALNEKDAKSGELIASLNSQVEALQAAAEAARDALETRRAEVEFIKGELKDVRRKLARSRTLQKYLIGGAAIAAIIAIFK